MGPIHSPIHAATTSWFPKGAQADRVTRCGAPKAKDHCADDARANRPRGKPVKASCPTGAPHRPCWNQPADFRNQPCRNCDGIRLCGSESDRPSHLRVFSQHRRERRLYAPGRIRFAGLTLAPCIARMLPLVHDLSRWERPARTRCVLVKLRPVFRADQVRLFLGLRSNWKTPVALEYLRRRWVRLVGRTRAWILGTALRSPSSGLHAFGTRAQRNP